MNSEKEKLLEFFSLMEKVLGQSAAEYINSEVFIKRLASAMGINTAGLIKSSEEVALERAEAQKQSLSASLAQKVFPALINNAENIQKVIDNMMGLSHEKI